MNDIPERRSKDRYESTEQRTKVGLRKPIGWRKKN